MEILAILSSASPGKSENHVQEFGKLPGTPKIPDVGKTGSSKTKKIIISGSLLQDLRTVSEIPFPSIAFGPPFLGKDLRSFCREFLYLGKP